MSDLQRKDIADDRMLGAIRDSWASRRAGGPILWPADFLPEFPEKVVDAKMEQLWSRGLIDYGVTLRSAWIVETRHADESDLRSA